MKIESRLQLPPPPCFSGKVDGRGVAGFISPDMEKTWENLSQDAIRNAIDLQPKIMEAIIAAEGGRTSCMSSAL